MLTFVLGAAEDESMKSAWIGDFAVVLAVAAGVGPTAIIPNAAQNAEKTSSRVGARRRGKFIRSSIFKFAAWTIATPVPRIG
jgi:hypothetical protein